MASGSNTTDLSQEQIEEFLHVFSLFDFFQVDRVGTCDLGRIFRYLRIEITQVELRRRMRQIDPEREGSFTSADFLAFMSRMKQEQDEKDRQQMQKQMELQPKGADAGAAEQPAEEDDHSEGTK